MLISEIEICDENVVKIESNMLESCSPEYETISVQNETTSDIFERSKPKVDSSRQKRKKNSGSEDVSSGLGRNRKVGRPKVVRTVEEVV